MKNYDVIIIGGGLAGCTLGYLLRKQNKSVLIVEKEKLKNKDKLCGGILTDKSYNLIKEIFGDSVNDLNFNYPLKTFVNNESYHVEMEDIVFYSIYRKQLDAFVLNKFLALNGDILENTTYKNLNVKEKTIMIDDNNYHYEFIVGADGVLSQLRHELTGRLQNRGFALESKLDNNNFKDIELFFLNNLRGYGWIVPNSENIVIGLGTVEEKIDITQDFKNLGKSLNLEVDSKRGAFIPSGNDILLRFNDDVFFIGDSAGLISPLTCEGIYYALLSAKILSDNFNVDYERKMKKAIKKIRHQARYKSLVYNDKIRGFASKLTKNKFLNKLMSRIAKGIL